MTEPVLQDHSSITIRAFNRLEDQASLQALDTSYVTDHVLSVAFDDGTIALKVHPLGSPLHKRFEVDDVLEADSRFDCILVAEDAGTVVALAALRLEGWNRRAVVEHLYVAPAYRGKRLARRLLDRLADEAARRNARCLWLEVQNTNPSAIHFYQSVGFTWCGVDTSLYDPATVSPDEVALFFTRPLTQP
jgi:ribosomal protein S18 acetylase RimI-like enzyme